MQHFSKLFNETLTYDNNQFLIINLESVEKDHLSQTNSIHTSSQKKINFQFESSPLKYLQKYQDDNSIISSTAFGKEK